MSKRAEAAAMEAYPDYRSMDGGYITQRKLRHCYVKGFEQAEKDVWKRIEKYLSKRNATDLATVGWILNHIEEYKKKIMEEE